MKTGKRFFIGSGVLLLLMLVAGYGFVSAGGPWSDPDRGFRPGFHKRGFHPGFHSRDMADFILWRMDRKADELNLTETQKTKYEKIKNNLKTHFSEGMDSHRSLRERFHEEMEKENPDVKSLVESVKTKIVKLSGFANEHLDLLVDFYDSLDGTQQRMITDEIRERMDLRPVSS